MKNRNGFTLVELLAVVVILGIIMMIAIPNTISMIDKNKMTTYIENAKTFVSLVQNKIETDKALELPVKDNQYTVMNLRYLNTNDISDSPYGEVYSKDYSFVAITLESGKYVYYVQLVSCNTGTETCSPNDLNLWRGVELIDAEKLNSDERFDYVKASGVNANMIRNLSGHASFSGKSAYEYVTFS